MRPMRNARRTARRALRVVHSGLSLRFPRFVRFRDDKGILAATTAAEIAELHHIQQGGPLPG